MGLIFKTCPTCGCEFVRTVKQVNSVIKRSGEWKCKPCATSKSNRERSRLIGATRISSQGYIFEKTESGWFQQHILVLERKLGRKLAYGEVGHHINGVRTDNHPDNIVLMTHGEHSALHNRERPVSKETARKIGIANQEYSIEKVVAARELVSSGVSQRKAALILGMPPMVISRIVRNITYKESE